MTEANIVFLIDTQNGFNRGDLTPAEGGSLKVPDSEETVKPAAEMVHEAENTIFFLSQDFHPSDHISFASNHMDVQPFSDIFLRRDAGGQYRAAAAEVAGQIRAVDTDKNGYITRIRDEILPADAVAGDVRQTTWFDHCRQGTLSAQFVPELMAELPKDLQHALLHDQTSPVLMAKDKRGNSFYVVRKGMRSDLDSYGIATENDTVSVTPAPALFKSLAQTLKEKGVTKALVSVGGWATNYCVEFSHKDIWKFLVPALREQSIQTHVQLLTDLCRGIPTPTLPDAFARMAALGSTLTTSASYLAANRCKKSYPEPA